jgi:predicted small secreted protein
MKIHLLRTLVLASLLILVGCNTVEGVGEDIEKGGEKMQKKANEVKHDM